jgi:diacylglycerol kinase (ATP)
LGSVRTLVTRAPGDEARLVAEALDTGCTSLAVLGGDGTWSKAARALVSLGADCRMALLAAGTGNDFAKTVGVPATDYAAMARLIAAGRERCVDVGRIEGREFINVVGFGVNAAVLEAMRPSGVLPRGVQYVRAALGQLFTYRGLEARIVFPDGETLGPATFLGIFIANGARVGGAFHIAPGASIEDGLFDVITLSEASSARRVRLFAGAMAGRHVGAPEVRVRRTKSVTIEFATPPSYDMDGELCIARSNAVEITCLSRALSLVALAP